MKRDALEFTEFTDRIELNIPIDLRKLIVFHANWGRIEGKEDFINIVAIHGSNPYLEIATFKYVDSTLNWIINMCKKDVTIVVPSERFRLAFLQFITRKPYYPNFPPLYAPENIVWFASIGTKRLLLPNSERFHVMNYVDIDKKNEAKEKLKILITYSALRCVEAIANLLLEKILKSGISNLE